MSTITDLSGTLEKVNVWLRDAASSAEGYEYHGEWFMQAELSDNIEQSFLALISISELIGADHIQKMIINDYLKASKENSFSRVQLNPEQDAYSPWGSKLDIYLKVLEPMLGVGDTSKVSRELLEIIRNLQYAVTDKNCFQSPANEAELHDRAEMVLKCVFSDLKRKPTITKSIKNFIPDTGIPSEKTLIEYKFLDKKESVGPISDEILADTRGYTSSDWKKFIYVVYETERFRPERDWVKHLRDCDSAKNTEIVVLCGEPTSPKKPKKKLPSKKKSAP